jgi:hypothetical protein
MTMLSLRYKYKKQVGLRSESRQGHCLKIPLFAYPQNSSIPDEKGFDIFQPDIFAISVGAHSCAMHSRLKAAPTITLSERELLGFSWVRT